MSIFDDKLTTCLEYAFRFDKAGKTELARDIAVKCAIYAADVNGVDVLRLFYGDDVYDNMTDVAHGVTYIFIAKCAAKAYASLITRNSVSSSFAPWAMNRDKCDWRLKSVFEWLSKAGRKVSDGDRLYFKYIVQAYEKKDVVPEYVLGTNIMSLSPSAVISGIVDHSIQVINGWLR